MGRICGINLSHNGSLAILEDGEVQFYVEEERLSRVKRDRSAYTAATQFLDDSIDVVTISDCFTKYNLEKYLLRTKQANKIIDLVKERGLPLKDYRDRHHECHAANAYYNSGFDNAAVIVMDGKGSLHPHKDWKFCETESIYDVSNGKFESVFKHYSTFWSEEESKKLGSSFWDGRNFYSNRTSVGQAYRRVSRYCGFDETHAGKTMGLSTYGAAPEDLFEIHNGHSVCSTELSAEGNTTRYTGIEYHPEDLAYRLQKSAEKHALFMLEKAYELTGRENVVLTGGFFLNCIANYQLLKTGINLYVDPLAYDGGLAIGSALLEHYENTLSRS